ncbi:MAG: prephenate dehydrogenase [Symbiobacteriia bacterium]
MAQPEPKIVAQPKPKTVVIVGLGLIGGSLALAWRQAGMFDRILALTLSQSDLSQARQAGAIDGGETAAGPWLAQAEALVLATPAGAILPMLDRCLPYLSPGCRITDVGSVKQAIVTGVARRGEGRLHFLGGHPMTGSEQSGFQAARSDLFRQATYVLTPTEQTDPSDLEYWQTAIAALGANIRLLNAQEHDETVAWTSHLPFLVACALARSVAVKDHPQITALVAGGWRDTTRVASGEPSMGSDMCSLNQEAILPALQGFRASLAELESMLRQCPGEQDSLRSELTRIKVFRDRLVGGA